MTKVERTVGNLLEVDRRAKSRSVLDLLPIVDHGILVR